MDITLSLAAIAIGLIILAISGDKLVDGAVTLARKFGVSELFIGIVIVGIGTSLPELTATLSAAKLEKSGLILGNIIGSNIANTAFIFGIALLIAKGTVGLRSEKLDYLLMLAGCALFSTPILLGMPINNTMGYAFIAMMVVALCLSLYMGRNKVALPDETEDETPPPITKACIFVVAGLIGLFIGADLLINGAVSIAETLGVPEHIIGLTLVAVGSSLPELAAAIAAARQNKLALTAGNILGSNLFNALGSGGIGALFINLYEPSIVVSAIIMLVVLLLLAPLFLSKKVPAKLYGLALILTYVAYIIFLTMD